MKIHAPQSGRSPRRIAHSAALLALALGSQAGCGREFFREWANHDVSEAIFEKSRDPRWRLDMFSVDPPALSRFADPYDPDRPPAPPDDFATQALSPVPQWPDNRLITPVEGTGYLDMLEAWQRERPQPAAAPARRRPRPRPLRRPPRPPRPTPRRRSGRAPRRRRVPRPRRAPSRTPRWHRRRPSRSHRPPSPRPPGARTVDHHAPRAARPSTRRAAGQGRVA